MDQTNFDIDKKLDDLLAEVGLSREVVGGEIRFVGSDPLVQSPFRLGAIAAVGKTAACSAAAAIWRIRSGRGQELYCDLRKVIHELAPFFVWPDTVQLNGIPPRELELDYLARNGYIGHMLPTRDGRLITFVNSYPGLSRAMSDVLGVSSHRIEEIRTAVARRDALELEEAASAAGAVAAMVRCQDEWNRTEQAEILSTLPTVEIERFEGGEPEPLTDAQRPLAGIRTLAMVRVISGGTMGMTLAEHGADVLNLWDPSEIEMAQVHYLAQLGMRSAWVRGQSSEGQQDVHRLLADADIFIENRRSGLVERRGLGFEECARIRPGIIHVSLRAYGHTGPWAERPAFDPAILAATGAMVVQGGSLEHPRKPPTEVVNDWLCGWLGAFGAMVALIRRAREGGSYRVRVSLARTCMWWMGWSHVSESVDCATPERQIRRPDCYTTQTVFGEYRGIACQVKFSETQPNFANVLLPRGSSKLEWLMRDPILARKST